MEQLRVESPGLWKSTVMAFREQRATGKGTKFDTLRHLETLKKAYVQESDDVWKPLLFSAYIRHYTSLPHPLTLSEQQAIAKWHADLQNPSVKKSEKKYHNPLSQQDEVLWICCVFVFKPRPSRISTIYSTSSFQFPLHVATRSVT